MTPFERKVLTLVSRIPVGRVITYGEVARLAGKPGAVELVAAYLGAHAAKESESADLLPSDFLKRLVWPHLSQRFTRGTRNQNDGPGQFRVVWIGFARLGGEFQSFAVVVRFRGMDDCESLF